MSVDKVEMNNNVIDKSKDVIDKSNQDSNQDSNQQFDFMSFLSTITDSKKENKTDAINQLLGNIFQSMLKNNSDETKSNPSSDSESNSDSESESSSESDSEFADLDTIYLIKEMDKEVVFTTTYSNAKSSLLSRFHHFLETNSSTSLRIDKTDDKIVAYDRNPNSLQPFQETLVFHCEFLRIEKQN